MCALLACAAGEDDEDVASPSGTEAPDSASDDDTNTDASSAADTDDPDLEDDTDSHTTEEDEAADCSNRALDDQLCDRVDLAEASCADFGLGVGTLACNPDCSLDISGCGPPGKGDHCSAVEPCPSEELFCVAATCFDGSPGDWCASEEHCQEGLSCIMTGWLLYTCEP